MTPSDRSLNMLLALDYLHVISNNYQYDTNPAFCVLGVENYDCTRKNIYIENTTYMIEHPPFKKKKKKRPI